jgi:hypothetical protein
MTWQLVQLDCFGEIYELDKEFQDSLGVYTFDDEDGTLYCLSETEDGLSWVPVEVMKRKPKLKRVK